MNDDKYIKEVCSKCKNRDEEKCSIVKRIDGTFNCECAGMDKGENKI